MIYHKYPFPDETKKLYKESVMNDSFQIEFKDNEFDQIIRLLLKWDFKERISSNEFLKLFNGCEDSWYKTS